jgi:hypothetical protein
LIQQEHAFGRHLAENLIGPSWRIQRPLSGDRINDLGSRFAGFKTVLPIRF